MLVPIPEFVVKKSIFALQAGSSDVAYGLLRILSVPVLKEGFVLRLLSAPPGRRSGRPPRVLSWSLDSPP